MNNSNNESPHEAESTDREMTSGDLSDYLSGAMRRIRQKLNAEKAARAQGTQPPPAAPPSNPSPAPSVPPADAGAN